MESEKKALTVTIKQDWVNMEVQYFRNLHLIHVKCLSQIENRNFVTGLKSIFMITFKIIYVLDDESKIHLPKLDHWLFPQ